MALQRKGVVAGINFQKGDGLQCKRSVYSGGCQLYIKQFTNFKFTLQCVIMCYISKCVWLYCCWMYFVCVCLQGGVGDPGEKGEKGAQGPSGKIGLPVHPIVTYFSATIIVDAFSSPYHITPSLYSPPSPFSFPCPPPLACTHTHLSRVPMGQQVPLDLQEAKGEGEHQEMM